VTTRETFGFAPDDPSFVADPYPAYRRLRAEAPLHYDEATDHWLVSRYEDVNEFLRDRRLGRTYRHVATDREMGRPTTPAEQAPFWHLIEHGILDKVGQLFDNERSLVRIFILQEAKFIRENHLYGY
jgi:cytochrome P450